MVDGDDIRVTAANDAKFEAAVLGQLLALHPVQLTLDELLLAVAVDPGDFTQRDAVERAVRELQAAGLLRQSGELILPSRAALRFDELLG